MLKRSVPLTFLLLGIFLVSCTSPQLREIDKAQQRWQEAGITSYKIEVLHVRSIWHAQSYVITVVDGNVTDSSSTCITAPMEFGECELEPFNPDDFTVPALFELARSKAQGPNPEYLTIRYSEQFGYPEQIGIDNPQAVDDDTSWIVKNFQPAP